MAVNVRETTIEEIEERLSEIGTDLNKIDYLESALKLTGFSFEVKRFLWGELSRLFGGRGMYERAAKAMGNKAGLEILMKEKSDSYVYAAELFSKVGKIEDAEEMFTRAIRDCDGDKKSRVRLARKNIYMISAKTLETKGKKASAVKFYEKLLKMNLDDIEKSFIREKLISTYKALGMFREARLLEGD